MSTAIPFEEQWLSHAFRQPIGETVPEVELRRVATALAKIAVSLACGTRRYLGARLDHTLCLADQVSEALLTIGTRLLSITTAASSQFVAEIRRRAACSIACTGHGFQFGTDDRNMDEIPIIIVVVHVRRMGTRRDRPNGTAL
jgi:hypothetical protein